MVKDIRENNEFLVREYSEDGMLVLSTFAVYDVKRDSNDWICTIKVPMKYLKIVKRLNNLEAVTSYIYFFDRFNRGSEEELRNTDVFYGSDGKCFEEFKLIKDCDIKHGELECT